VTIVPSASVSNPIDMPSATAADGIASSPVAINPRIRAPELILAIALPSL